MTEAEVAAANETVLREHRPVCLHHVGVSLLDDVGGLSGFAGFLAAIYEGEDKEERDELRTWAKGLGWSEKKIASKKIL